MVCALLPPLRQPEAHSRLSFQLKGKLNGAGFAAAMKTA